MTGRAMFACTFERAAARASVALVLLAMGCAPGSDAGGRRLYEHLRAACVEVLANGHLEGSGWFADGQGLVVTAAHAVEDRRAKLEVLSPAAGRMAAELVAWDRGHDLALLRVPPAKAPYPALPVADSAPGPNAEVFLLGSPMFRHGLLLPGRVAAGGLSYEYMASKACYTRCFYICAPSPKGTSGGCWVDAGGRVVGSQSGYVGTDAMMLGIAYAAPPQAIRRLLETRRPPATATVESGVEELWEQPREFIARFPAGSSGIVPVQPRKGGPADRAGLKPNTLITAVDGVAVAYRDQFLALVRARSPGQEIVLRVLDADGAAPREVKVRLGDLEARGR